MATIIQKPDTLSLSRNLKELIISTSSEISLQLLKGDSLLLEETYLPDVNNRVHVDLADIVTSSLSLTMPSGDAVSTSQGSIYSDFTVKVDGTSVAEFTAVRSGVERFSDTAANFLTANWLTWQPQVKEVLQDQPEWLTYYPASGFCACYARFYYTDGTSGEIKVCDVSQCVSINTRFSKLWALDESGKERYGVIDVYIKDAQGLRLTYVQRYVLCSQGALDEVYLCENSLGGLDTFRFYGDRKLVPEIGYTSLLLDNSYTAADPNLSRKWSQNTGMLTGRECEWCWELFRSSAAYHLYRGTILPIVLDASSVEKSAMSVLAAYSFDYRYASDLGLLNVVRSENLPEVVEISGPDAEVFFLKPRLNEYPSAVLSDDLIIPVQSPYEESWYTLSVGGLKSALLSSVETIYGPMWHEHDNLQVLNGLSVDSSGNLLYNGVQVGSGIVGAHDHHGETIRPEKIIVGDVEITCVDGRLHISKGLVSDGDIAAFGAEEGEEGGSGGLDIARLWEELEAEDSSKVIDVSHIPGSVVLQDELVEILDDYPLTTEMNEALSGKAGKDWVEEELAKYLLLTGGKISGDLEVTGTLKIGEAVLSYQDGRLRISKGVVSDGDLAAFSAEEGEEGGSGGLDIARLWEELEAEDASKVIDESHIPGSVVLQDELTDALAPYVKTTAMNTALAGKAALQHTHAISEVTGLQTALNSKWEWNASQVAGVKVNSAVAADNLASSVRINGTPFNGESDIVTARWGKSRTITVWDFYNVNKQAAQGIDGSADFALKLPQSIKVKTLNIDGVTLSVVGGRLHVDSTLTADGDLVAYGDEEGSSSSGGLDIARLWEALGGSMENKKISALYLPDLPKATASVLGGVKLRYDSVQTTTAQPATTTPARTYGVQVDSSGRLVVNVPWEDYSSADLIMWDWQTTLESKIDAMDSAIAGKAAASHEHPLSEISNLGSGWSAVLVTNLDKEWRFALTQPKPAWLEQTQAELGGYIPVFGDEEYWIATDSHTHDIDEIGGLGNGWAAALTAAKPSWLTSVPKATDSAYGGFKTGYPEATGSRYYAVELNTLGQAYVHVPWTNTTYTLASFGITATAGEINKLDGVTATTAEINCLDGVTSSIQTQLNGKVPTSRTINGIALSSNITLTGANIKLTGYTEGSSTAVVAAGDTINAALAKLQNQIQTKQASGSYMTTDTAQTITGLKTTKAQPWAVRMSMDTSNSVNGLVWKDTSGTSIAGLNYHNTAKRIFINANYPDITDIWSDAAGKYSLRIGWNELTYNSYPILRSDNVGSYALTKSNYTSTLDGRYMRIGSSGYPTAYRKVFNVNGTAWSFLGTTTDAPTIYAPTTAGTSGYVLRSTGGTPGWVAQNTLVVKGIYENSLGVTVGDTMADLKAGLKSLMGGAMSKPGSMGYVTASSVSTIMSNWSNDSYALAAGSRTNFLRLDGYGTSTYGVFLVSGFDGSFYRLLKNNSTTWAGPYTILDTGNYTSHLDSRYVNVSGDTMTGNLTVPRLVVRGTVTGNSTRYIYSDAADNIYMSVGGVVPLVARPECVRRGASAASVTLGTSTYPWADTYTKKLHITDTSSVAHLSFGRTDAFNYISLPGASSTLAIAPGGDISGAGSALCISNSATYPGYSSGTRSLGTSSYRWSNIYSVAGNFSGAVTISSTLTLGAGITGVSTITGEGFAIGTNNLKIYDSTSKANRITANWSDGVARIYAINEAGTTYSDLCIGQTQTQASFLYYDASVARWGLGTKSPAYKLDVAGTLRATGRITAAGLTSSASITANAGITTTTLSASGAVTLSSTLTAAGLVKASAGVQIGSTSDYGWYISAGTRISAGINVARGVNVGSLLVSSAWADYTKVPTNGIYCKGNMQVARIGVGSSPNSNYAICTNGDAYLYNTIHTGDIHAQGNIDCAFLSALRLYVPSSEGNNKYYIRIE